MRVGLIGWYGHDNAGDDRILHCLRRVFAAHDLVVTGGYPDASRRQAELDRCDLIVLGGGGMVLRKANMHAPLLERLRAPLVCLGIGVESVHTDNRRFLAVLEEKAELIWVRDSESTAAFSTSGKVLEGPDLTFLEPFDIAPVPAGEACALNLRPWMFWRSEFQGRRHLLMSRLVKWFPDLERVYPFPRWRPESVVRHLRATFERVIPLPLYSERGNANDVTLLSRFFPDTPTAFDLANLQACRYVVAMRLHALIFAAQMGIPFVALSYMPKNQRFCARADMAEYSLDLFRPSPLPELLARVRDRAPGLRNKLLDFRAAECERARRLMREVSGRLGVA